MYGRHADRVSAFKGARYNRQQGLTVKDHGLIGWIRGHQRAGPALHELLAVRAIATVPATIGPGTVWAGYSDRIDHQIFAAPFVDVQSAVL